MRLYGSLKELVSLVFRKSTFQVTVQPGTVSADTTYNLPTSAGGTKEVTTNDATQTLTNKTISGATLSGTIAGTPTFSGVVTFSSVPLLPNDTIETNDIQNLAVTNAKIASGVDAVKIADGSVSNVEFQFLDGVTSAVQTQLDNKQPLDGDLTAIAALTTTGLIARTATNTATTRTITAGSSKIAITNGGGVAGDPTVDVTEANLNVANMTGTVAINHGGTGQITQQAAMNALAGTQTANRVLRSNGLDTQLSQVVLSTDVTGTLPIANGGTGQTTQTAAFNALDPLTTKGDIITNDGTNSVRQAVGTDGFALVADSSQTNGIKWAAVTPSFDSTNEFTNLSLAASVSSNALTIALKDKAGSNPSAGSPVTIAFRNATSATGTYAVRSVTASLSTVISSGSTLGHVSAVAQYAYIYVLDNAGTVELAVSSKLFDDGSIQSTTAEGGAGAATSYSGLYSTTARSNVPIRLIGRFLSTQTTAGTWAAVPTELTSGHSLNQHQGTTTNDAAKAGYVGEVIDAISTSFFTQASPTAGTYYDVTGLSITLTPGQWTLEVCAAILINSTNSATGLVHQRLALRTGSTVIQEMIGPLAYGLSSAQSSVQTGTVSFSSRISISANTSYKVSTRYNNVSGTPSVTNIYVDGDYAGTDGMYIRATRVR